MKKIVFFSFLHFFILHPFLINLTHTHYFSEIEEMNNILYSEPTYKEFDVINGLVGAIGSYQLLQKIMSPHPEAQQLVHSIEIVLEKNNTPPITELKQYLYFLLKQIQQKVTDLEYKQILFHVAQNFEKKNIGSLYPLLYNEIITELKTVLSPKSPHKKTKAHVRKRIALAEKEIVHRRKKESHILHTAKPKSSALRIGIAMSGGGPRAMILTGGYIEGLQHIGILDQISYISSLSGSSWYISQWVAMQGNTTQLNKTLKQRFEKKLIKLTKNTTFNRSFMEQFIDKSLLYKKVYKQQISSVDFFGALLEHTFKEPTKNFFTETLSAQAEIVNDHNLPIPLYTSMGYSNFQDAYDFYEFSPYEITNLTTNHAIPSWAIGRLFNKGESIDFAPEPPLSFLLGIWGSAYTATVGDIKNMANMFIKNSKLCLTERITFSIKQAALSALDYIAAKKRLSPAQIFNPFRECTDCSQAQQDEYITLLDAGIDSNIALAPLLVPEREIDIIIVTDSSYKDQKRLLSGIPIDLIPSIQHAKKRYGYNYTREYFFDDHNKHVMPVFHDINNPKAPTIIYIDFQGYEELFKKINSSHRQDLINDITEHALSSFNFQSTHLATFNFDYSGKEFDQLQKIARFNVVSQAHELNEIIDHIRRYKNN